MRNNIDQRLQHAATLALGERRGAVIVMDPQTGRIRAVVNPQLAFAEKLSGSAPQLNLSCPRGAAVGSD